MKAILIVFLVTLSLNGVCQKISFKLFGYNPCTQEVKQISLFGLKKGDTTFSIVDTTGILRLEERGAYSLSYAMDNIDTTEIGKSYMISKEGLYIDTLQLVSIFPCLEPTSHPSFIGYCCCDKKCEGEQTDFYYNGNKRIEGCFKAGIPKGELKIYYLNGQLKQLDKYNKKGKLVKRVLYENNGKVKNVESY